MHISKHRNGYRVVVQVGGSRRSKVTRTYAAAERAGSEFVLDLGGPVQKMHVTVGKLLASWLNAATLSATYRADVTSIVGRLPATFTKRQIATVTPAVVEHLYRKLGDDGWSPHRVGRCHTVLSSAWKMAQRYEWIRDNPMTVARKPAVARPDLRPPTQAEVQQLINAASAELVLYLRLSTAIGARRGEVLGLQWADLSGTSIKVRRSVAYTSASGAVTKDSKTGTKGHRTIAITDILAKQLRDLHVAQKEKALKAGLPSPVWMFSHDAGQTHWRPGYVSLYFRRLCAREGIIGVRLHSLRHHMATEMLAAGVPLHIVSRRLGHSKIATTADVYVDYIPAADQEAADALERRQLS